MSSSRSSRDGGAVSNIHPRSYDVVCGGRLTDFLDLGEATLMNRIKSHPDVGERWYPDLLKQIRAQQAAAAQA
jgi:hypothetical protein